MNTEIEQLREQLEELRRDFDMKLELKLSEQYKFFEGQLERAERKARIDILTMVGGHLMNAVAPIINTANDMYIYRIVAISDTEEVNPQTFYAQRQGGVWVISSMLDGKMQVFDWEKVVPAMREKVEEFLAGVDEEQNEIAFNVYRG